VTLFTHFTVKQENSSIIDSDVAYIYKEFDPFIAWHRLMWPTLYIMKYVRVFASVHTVELRLVDGPSNYEGRLEVYYAGQWGTICDRYGYFEAKEADVACHQLGFQ